MGEGVISDYITGIVQPTLAEYFDAVTDRRRCFLACLTAYHVVDRIAEARALNCKSAQQAGTVLKRECPSFEVIEHVALALKHVKAGGGPGIRLQEDNIIVRPPAIWGEMVWDLSRWGDATGGIEAKETAQSVDVTAALRAVSEYITNKFVEADNEPSSGQRR